MATGTIITAFQAVPWTEVLSNAPTIAEGARKLWNAVTRRAKVESSSPAETENSSAIENNELSEVKGQVANLTESVRSLEEELKSSLGLIKALAEQNSQFIQRIELNRIRLQQLSVAVGVVAVLAVLSVAFQLLKQ